MLIFIDKRISESAKQKLADYGDLVEVESNGIVYDSISGHPDIFMCQIENQLIVAPNTPGYLTSILKSNEINFLFGEKYLSNYYPSTSFYNALVSSNFLIHNLKYTDVTIVEKIEKREIINIKQSYTRCNLIEISENVFITSDKEIFKKINRLQGCAILYIDPVQISLPGHSYGFFGGCCGVYNNKLFILGSLDYLKEKIALIEFTNQFDVEIIELSDNQLFDGGGIFFIEN